MSSAARADRYLASPVPVPTRDRYVVVASLPEADTIIYVNPQRILNEVVPKFMPAKDVEGMRKAFDDVRKNAGVDPTKIGILGFSAGGHLTSSALTHFDERCGTAVLAVCLATAAAVRGEAGESH